MRRLKLVILLAGLALSLRGERVEPFRLVPAFPGIAFKEPIFLAQEPAANPAQAQIGNPPGPQGRPK